MLVWIRYTKESLNVWFRSSVGYAATLSFLLIDTSSSPTRGLCFFSTFKFLFSKPKTVIVCNCSFLIYYCICNKIFAYRLTCRYYRIYSSENAHVWNIFEDSLGKTVPVHNFGHREQIYMCSFISFEIILILKLFVSTDLTFYTSNWCFQRF